VSEAARLLAEKIDHKIMEMVYHDYANYRSLGGRHEDATILAADRVRQRYMLPVQTALRLNALGVPVDEPKILLAKGDA
jgi:hypothetical protein